MTWAVTVALALPLVAVQHLVLLVVVLDEAGAGALAETSTSFALVLVLEAERPRGSAEGAAAETWEATVEAEIVKKGVSSALCPSRSPSLGPFHAPVLGLSRDSALCHVHVPDSCPSPSPFRGLCLAPGYDDCRSFHPGSPCPCHLGLSVFPKVCDDHRSPGACWR